MEDLISVMQKIESLDARDYRSFMAMMNRRKVMRMLFKTFYQQLIDDQSRTGIDEAHRIIDLVLRAKQAQEQTHTDSTDVTEDFNLDSTKISNVPTVILSEVSSYLNYKEQMNLRTMNRSFFVLLGSPSVPLHDLPSKWLVSVHGLPNGSAKQNRQTKWWETRLIKSIDIHCSDFGNDVEPHQKPMEPSSTIYRHGPWNYQNNQMDLETDQQPMESMNCRFMSKAQCLTITCRDDKDLSDILSKLILSQTAFPHLKKLILRQGDKPEWFERRNCPETLKKFMSLISRSNLEHFLLDSKLCGNANVADLENTHCDYESTKNLKALTSSAYDCLYEHMDPAIELESLHFTSKVDTEHMKGLDGKMSHLKELCIGVKCNDIGKLLKGKMNNLRRLNIGGYLDTLCAEENAAVVVWLSEALETLEYLCTDYDDDKEIVQVMEVLHKILEGQKVMKKQLKIRLKRYEGITDANTAKPVPTEQGISNVFKMIKILIGTLDKKVIDWMLIVNGLYTEYTSRDYEQLKAECAALQKEGEYVVEDKWRVKSVNMGFQQKEHYEYHILFSNKGYKIGGVQEKWISECSNCQKTFKQEIFFR